MTTINKEQALMIHLTNNFLPYMGDESVNNVIDCMTRYWNKEITLYEMVNYIDDERIYGEFLNSEDAYDCERDDMCDDDIEDDTDHSYEFHITLKGLCYDGEQGSIDTTVKVSHGFDDLQIVKDNINALLSQYGSEFRAGTEELEVIRYDVSLDSTNQFHRMDVTHMYELCEDFIPNSYGVKIKTLFVQ